MQKALEKRKNLPVRGNPKWQIMRQNLRQNK